MMPEIPGPIFCDEGEMSLELHIIMRSWVKPKETEVKWLYP